MIIKIIRGIVYAIVAYFIGSVFYWTYTYNHRANTPQVSTTNTTNSTVQKSLDAGANVNNVDIERYKQNFANACIEAIPQASAQTKNYCKCMADKIYEVYSVGEIADMELSMTQEQAEKEFMPYAKQCIAENGISFLTENLVNFNVMRVYFAKSEADAKAAIQALKTTAQRSDYAGIF